MNRFYYSLLTLFFAVTTSAHALSLDQAKSGGLVGETPSGYLEAVAAPTREVTAVIQDINSKRRDEYNAIAKKNGTALEAVEQLAGKKAIERTVSGNYVKVNGNWIKK